MRWVSALLTAQKLKFSIKNFFCKCEQIRRKLRIWLDLLKKSLMENSIFCAMFSLYKPYPLQYFYFQYCDIWYCLYFHMISKGLLMHS